MIALGIAAGGGCKLAGRYGLGVVDASARGFGFMPGEASARRSWTVSGAKLRC